ncbi:hypothetical protein [Streptomyces sp. NPDC047985]|uniref:hypothetical protein n=1 Tax=unclassified Streptomyces TaxID=2593676 RepID=UPI00342E673D
MKITVCALVVGAGFGAVTSLANALSSPYSALGAPLAGTVWAGTAKVLSLLVGLGWAWAALAVVMGWLAKTWTRGAVAGALALVAATAAYYPMDALVRDEPLALYWPELLTWWLASVLFGPVLGVVGAAIERPGVTGLLAGLTVPVGGAAQMIVLPPRPDLAFAREVVLAEAVIWTTLAIGAGWAVYRFWAGKRARTDSGAPTALSATSAPSRVVPSDNDATTAHLPSGGHTPVAPAPDRPHVTPAAHRPRTGGSGATTGMPSPADRPGARR